MKTLDKIVSSIMVIFPLSVLGGDISFMEAKMLADKSEKLLKSDEMQGLVRAQADVAGSAFPYCINTTKSQPSDFTVILQLDSDGKVLNTWFMGDSMFSKCFRTQFRISLKYKPAYQPFYTAFEYKHKH